MPVENVRIKVGQEVGLLLNVTCFNAKKDAININHCGFAGISDMQPPCCRRMQGRRLSD